MAMRSEAVSSEPVGAHARFDFIRLEDFPLVPVLILVGFALVAVFANMLAPHDPEVG